jgi:hypothetical protein
MNNLELSKRYFNIWVDMNQAGKLEGIASERGVDVGAVVQEILSPVLGDDENTGRFILLRIPERTYRVHLKWFDGDVELAKSSMVGSLEVTAQEFAQCLKKVGEME